MTMLEDRSFLEPEALASEPPPAPSGRGRDRHGQHRSRGHSPPALFMWLVRGSRATFMTQVDEDAAPRGSGSISTVAIPGSVLSAIGAQALAPLQWGSRPRRVPARRMGSPP